MINVTIVPKEMADFSIYTERKHLANMFLLIREEPFAKYKYIKDKFYIEFKMVYCRNDGFKMIYYRNDAVFT